MTNEEKAIQRFPDIEPNAYGDAYEELQRVQILRRAAYLEGLNDCTGVQTLTIK